MRLLAALVGALGALLACAAAAWLVDRDPPPAGRGPGPRPAAIASLAQGRGPAAVGFPDVSDEEAVRNSGARERVPAAPAESTTPVRVRGRVLWRGRALAGVAVSFLRAEGEGETEEDWDFSDEEGAFEVQLAPACYRVLADEELATGSLEVPRERTELAWDLHLARGPADR